MQQPQGFICSSHPHHVCKLLKSLYSVKQAPRSWFERFTFYLLNLDFVASQADSSLFVRISNVTITYLLLYVDDRTPSRVFYIFIRQPNFNKITAFKTVLNTIQHKS